MATLADLLVSITGDVSGVQRAFDQVSSSVGKLGSDMQALGGRMQSMGTSMSLYITAPLAAFGAMSLKTAVDFDDSMRKVQAVTGETGEGFQQLTEYAMQLGADTAFSSSQAADAMLQLGQAGFTTTEIMTATGQVLSLASAGALDLGTAAGVTANALNGFGLEADSTQRVVDVLAKGAAISTTDIQGLGNALSYVAPVAHAMGMTLEETTSIIAALSNAGIEGERAGTSLRGAISALASPTDQMAAIFGKYGIALDKVNPATNTFTQILDTLTAAGMTSADVMAIFGREAGPGVLALLSQGTGAIKEQTIALENSTGAAEQMAATMEGGVGGAMRQLQGSVETLSITMGNLIAVAILPLINHLKDLANWLAGMPAPVQKIAIAFAALAAAIGPVLIVAGTLISSIGAISGAIAGAGGLSAVLATVVGILTGPVAIAIAAFAAAAYIVYKNWDTVGPLVQRTFDTIRTAIAPVAIAIQAFVAGALTSFSAWWSTNGPAIIQAAGRVADFMLSAFKAMAATILYFTSGPLSNLWNGFQQAVNIIIPILRYLGEQVGNVIMLVVNLINGNWAGAWQNARNIVTTASDFMRSVLTALGSAIISIISNIASGWLNRWNEMFNATRTIMTNVYNAIVTTMNNIVSWITSAIARITSSWTGGWNALLNTARTILNSVLSIVTSILNSILSAFTNAISRITSTWSSGLGGLVGIASSAMKSVASTILGSASSLASAANSAGSAAVSALQTQLAKVQYTAAQIKAAAASGTLIASSSGGSSSSGSSSGSTGIKRQGDEGTGEGNVSIREKHATGGIAGYTGWHWMEKNELAVPAGFDWDTVLVAPIQRSLIQAAKITSNALGSGSISGGGRGGGSVSNSYGGDTINIQNVTLTPEYDFNKMMSDIERYNAQKRFQRGVVL